MPPGPEVAQQTPSLPSSAVPTGSKGGSFFSWLSAWTGGVALWVRGD